MSIQYRKLMKEWEITLDSPVLDPAFVTKATDFEARLKAGSLTDEQIKAIDNELVEMFNKLDKEEVDSPEMAKEKRKNRILEAKEKIATAESVEEISRLEAEYGDVSDDLAAFIVKRKEKVVAAQQQSDAQKFISDALKEVAAAGYGSLEALLEKYKDYPDVTAAISKRIADEKKPQEQTIREKVQAAKKRQWTYDELRAVGIEPTGDHMTIEGIYFERQYLYKIYLIKSVDGEKI